MSNEIINPFKQVKKTDWAKKAQERFKENKTEIKTIVQTKTSSKKKEVKKSIKRVAKSFKVYPGDISKIFDKRVNKLQVHFDDLDYDKDFVDSGKYIMFLMSLAEKYKLYELYDTVDEKGNLNIDMKKLEKLFK